MITYDVREHDKEGNESLDYGKQLHSYLCLGVLHVDSVSVFFNLVEGDEEKIDDEDHSERYVGECLPFLRYPAKDLEMCLKLPSQLTLLFLASFYMLFISA
jgi:hypothetical protein